MGRAVLGRFNLPLRLVGLLAAAILPAMAALLYVQIGLRHDRTERVRDGTLHQAELLSAEVETLVDAGRQLTLAMTQLDTTQTFAPGCAAQLMALRQALDSYGLLAVISADGQVICATRPIPAGSFSGQIAAALTANHFMVGLYTPGPGGAPTLPMLQPFVGAGGRRGVAVAAIDLDWLERHLRRFHQIPSNSINVSDTAGTVLVRLPGGLRWRGGKVTRGARALVNAAQPGTVQLIGLDGMSRVVGYVPATLTGGMYVSYGTYLPDVLVTIDRAAQNGYVLIGVCALLSVLLMLVITRRLVHLPTEALLNAAQRWSAGDLAARANPNVSETNEFGRLAAAFNIMAETLDARRHELTDLNASLEARVTERTHALSETNNRLLVEIGERERTDAALRQAQKLQAVGQLAGGMAHEFNNLLTTVMGALEMLSLRAGQDRKLQTYISSAFAASKRGARLTSQLLAFARRRRLMLNAVDLNAVLGDVRELLEGSLGHAITLKLELQTDLKPALGDRHEIEAAILNLALNARDAMPAGGTLRIETRNSTIVPTAHPNAGAPEGGQKGGAFVELIVADDGEGMDENALAHAVDPFFTTKSPGGGAGLGLSQVHGLASQLGGDLRLESGKGRGTTVRLLLPQAEAACAPMLCASPPTGPLLLVDDDAQVRQITAEMLGELGYDVTAASGGAEALELLAHRPIDMPFIAMVADYAMPGMSGVELIQAVRRRQPGLVTLMITGYMDFAGSADADVLTPREVLRKPFTLGELSGRIAELAARAPEEV